MVSGLETINSEILELIQYRLQVSKTHLGITNNIVICDERSFEGWFEDSELEPTTIYVIVSFEEGTLWIDNAVLNVAFTIYSEQESFESTRQLLTYFANAYNFARTTTITNGSVLSSFNLPQMREEFAKEGDNYRAIYDLSGTFVYGKNVSGVSKIEINDEEITFLNCDVNFFANPNSVNIGIRNDRTTTQNKSASFVMAFTFPSTLSNNFSSALDGLMFGSENINQLFEVKITKGSTTYTKSLHMVAINLSQEITNIPMWVVSLGE